ncbi:MAG: heavy metal translocating P-type ATPase [Acidobacteriota bacterium]
MLMAEDDTRMKTGDFTVKSLTPGRLRVGLSDSGLLGIGPATANLIRDGWVHTLAVNPVTGTALLTFDGYRVSETRFMEHLLANWCPGPDESKAILAALPPRSRKRSLRTIATLRAPLAILRESAGRIRVFHPAIGRYPPVNQRLEGVLAHLDGVTGHSVNPTTATVLVKYNDQVLRRSELLRILESTILEATGNGDDDLVPSTPVPDATTLRLTLSSAAMGIALAGSAVPAAATVGFITTIAVSCRIFGEALRALLTERKLKVDVLDATVIALAVASGRLISASFMVWVVDVSDALLNASEKASRRRLTEIFGRRPHLTHRLEGESEVECRVSDLNVDDLIVIRSGEQIPVDGLVASGNALVDQSALTGEYAPAERTEGERVFSMSSVLTGKLHVTVTQTGADTNASRMIQLIEQSLEHKVHLQSLTERFADLMVAPTLALGGVGYWTVGSDAMLAVINADFGTGIRIAGPLALLSSQTAAIKNGVLIKRGAVLEQLSDIDAVVFDKTGTLTSDVPAVHRVIPLIPSLDESELLARVACAEQRFSHPIARSILRAAADRNVAVPPISDSDYKVGFGVTVQLDGETWRVGSRRFIEGESISIPAKAKRYIREIHAAGGAAVFAASGNHLAGLIELRSSPRPEAGAIIRFLRQERGIEDIYLLSGDHEAPTRTLSKQLGIEHHFSEVLPQNKARHIQELQEKGRRVAMIGDGINDTAGLAQADCSISLQGATDAATDIADIVFLDGNLGKFELLFQISDNLNRNVRKSFGLVLVPNSICIAGALTGYFGLGMSLLFNNVFNLVATANGLRAQSALVVPEQPGHGSDHPPVQDHAQLTT